MYSVPDGDEPDQRAIPLCRTTHRNVHLVYDALKAGRHPPPVNRYTLAIAREGLRRLALAEAKDATPTAASMS